MHRNVRMVQQQGWTAIASHQATTAGLRILAAIAFIRLQLNFDLLRLTKGSANACSWLEQLTYLTRLLVDLHQVLFRHCQHNWLKFVFGFGNRLSMQIGTQQQAIALRAIKKATLHHMQGRTLEVSVNSEVLK